MSNETKPVAITEAETAERTAALEVRQAKAELTAAEAAHAGAAEADARAFEQAAADGKPEPVKLPSVALNARLGMATARLTARQAVHARAVARLDETYRAEAPAWSAAVLAVAERDEAEAMALVGGLAEAIDRAKASRALASWVATARRGTPAPFTRLNGATSPSGERLLRDLVERHLGVTQRSTAVAIGAAVQLAADTTAAAEAARVAAAEQRQRDHDEQKAGEARVQQRHLDNLARLVG